MAAADASLIPAERIERAILVIRGHKVLLDRDLAALYGVRPIALRQQVKRNLRRFPPDFMFQLSPDEAALLVSQSVIPSRQHLGGFLPYAFTEQGVAMLASVLHSLRAIQVNIAIVRTFVRLRALLASHSQLAHKLDALERRYDLRFKVIFDAIRRLMAPSATEPKRPIGFKLKDEEPCA